MHYDNVPLLTCINKHCVPLATINTVITRRETTPLQISLTTNNPIPPTRPPLKPMTHPARPPQNSIPVPSRSPSPAFCLFVALHIPPTTAVLLETLPQLPSPSKPSSLPQTFSRYKPLASEACLRTNQTCASRKFLRAPCNPRRTCALWLI
ncbi:hypothetical protein SNOG_04828 [Parastagonospora nodorum SN15]|uniref:Uncharacterized protein n=1 Tax=Phaeosphaeria nodorum (strain SN15 / ATCC MYA-4574 / FGSC 10173) TaxID=321614 RepID=Q0UTT6_PHANO|nr:hypothetical protein SNOG_04828 [Parastagonospora nodorum SN15]EAT87219.1 hypothetical protein SNOG_04828 [Parastagonospora nodorum SN15]